MIDPIFFIGLLPGSEIQQEVTGFKNECAERFGARHALKSPPHITLIPPFRWRTDRLAALKETLALFAPEQEPFEVGLRNFNCFRPRVIYVAVAPNDSLSRLQRALQAELSKSPGLPGGEGRRFHPHITIAHRDLAPEVFPAAWKWFSGREYWRNFKAVGLTLLRHDGGRWHIEGEFFFEYAC
jgi:2'-5' RNA ligase